MTGWEQTEVRSAAARAEGVRQLCLLIVAAFESDEPPASPVRAIEAVAWMAGEISDHLDCIADPANK